MSKVKYRYNPESLKYEKVNLTWKERFVKTILFIGPTIILCVVSGFVAVSFLESPSESKLKREYKFLKKENNQLSDRIENAEDVLAHIEEKDDYIYRSIFEADPYPSNIRKMGTGGVNKYRKYEGYDVSDLVIGTSKKLDILEKRLYAQSKSFDEVIDLAEQKEKLLASVPLIMPVSNKKLKRMASGFGLRTHPILKIRKMHYGLDFTADTGTEIYVTGDGVIEKVEKKRSGFGWHVVVNHGFGYKTLYAHMSGINTKKGKRVKRGDVIGYVGNTGLSSGPHLHYEVHKGGKKVNPVHYIFKDLSPEEYEQIIELSSSAQQSLD